VKLNKGILIVFEGIDGAGKTTQARIILQELQSKGYDAVFFREPSDSQWGRLIKEKAAIQDSLTPQEELDLFQKDRKYNIENNLKPALEEKKIVVLDRYYFSTIAYQGAKGIDPETIKNTNESFSIKPDLVFILDIDADEGLKRIENRKEKDLLFEREEYLIKVRSLFKSLKSENISHINAADSKELISERIRDIVFQYIKSVSQ